MGRLVLVTGGARSGKSAVAERRLAELAPPPWTYVATSIVGDDDEEWVRRVAKHRERRDPQRWALVEEPRAVGAALGRTRGALVDCITLWLTNRLLDDPPASDEALLGEAEALGEAARSAPGPVVLVTNEVGAGIVPESALARRFRDLQGWVNQRLAARADEVYLVAAGLPLRLK